MRPILLAPAVVTLLTGTDRIARVGNSPARRQYNLSLTLFRDDFF
ncbi:hypothetical protein [Methylovirgula sp. 4M-Z18]|nr:hypothetical protein [Methylovirgula sp. 4M-Z18]